VRVGREQALVDKQALELAARHKEETHQRELHEAVKVVEQLQAAFHVSQQTDDPPAALISRLRRVSSESSRDREAAKRSAMLDTLGKLASPESSSGTSQPPPPPPPPPKKSEVLDMLSKLSTPPGSSDSLASAVSAVEPKRSAMLEMLTKLATPPESVASDSSEPPRKSGSKEVLDTLTLLATPPPPEDREAEVRESRGFRFRSSVGVFLLRVARLSGRLCFGVRTSWRKSSSTHSKLSGEVCSLGSQVQAPARAGSASEGVDAPPPPRLRPVGSLAEVGELLLLCKAAANLHRSNPATASPRISRLLLNTDGSLY
jgi:hypothetical protein